jgi:DNA mismatch endonuclease, patch repair protein
MAPRPYPHTSDQNVSKRMRANPKRDTKPEVRVRSGLHRAGLRFRKNLAIRLPDRSVRPDVVFTRAKLAVFVDGCFWHQCPEHGNVPRTNVDYWVPKLRRNVERDRATDAALEIAGWHVIRAWEHEPVERTVERVLAATAGAARPSAA